MHTIITISPDGTVHHATRAMPPTLGETQQLVGGYVEAVGLPFAITAYLNEDGIALELDPNPVAYSLLHGLQIGLIPNSAILGTVVFMSADDDGDWIGLSPKQQVFLIASVETAREHGPRRVDS